MPNHFRLSQNKYVSESLQNHNFCNCLRCGSFKTRIFGADGKVNRLSVESGTYLMHCVLRDATLKNHPSRLSVRWVRSGSYAFEIEGRNYLLQPGNFLIVGSGQTYNSAIDPQKMTESLSVSFHRKILTDVLDGVSRNDEWLLDNPFKGGDAIPKIDFLTDLYSPNAEIKILLEEFSKQIQYGKNPHQTFLEQSFYQLMERILFLQKQVRLEIKQIPGAKPATREELYRRVKRARDFIRANAGEELKIEQIARVACLSPFHFLRSYKAAFGTTPHQEITDVRLEKAVLLMNKDKNNFTLGRIAVESGFQNLSSFSKAFRQKFKMSPSKFDLSGK